MGLYRLNRPTSAALCFAMLSRCVDVAIERRKLAEAASDHGVVEVDAIREAGARNDATQARRKDMKKQFRDLKVSRAELSWPKTSTQTGRRNYLSYLQSIRMIQAIVVLGKYLIIHVATTSRLSLKPTKTGNILPPKI